MNRLPAPHGDCAKNAKTAEYIFQDKEYSTEVMTINCMNNPPLHYYQIQGCQRSCIQRYLINQCGCGDPRFPKYKNTSNCPVDEPRLRNILIL